MKQQSIQEWTLNLNWSDKKVKTKNLLGCFEINSMFRTSVHCFFPTFHALITWFELSRVKLYRNELRGNKTYFELSRVRVTEGKITVNVRRKSRGNRHWFELARGSSQRGSSYRESTVSKYLKQSIQ